MARIRRKKSLYEVISKGQVKPDLDQPQPELPQPQADTDKRADSLIAAEKDGRTGVESPMPWPRKPAAVRLNGDRIEISVPYQLAVAFLLGLILLVLAVFRLGLGSRVVEKPAGQEAVKVVGKTAAPPPASSVEPKPDTVQEKPIRRADVKPAEETGNNRIVIQTYQNAAHLQPVKQYFSGLGIDTEIRKIDNWYYLVTAGKYNNPEKPGTDGYAAKQKIIGLGAGYKAPLGYESFGTRPFSDAYGMRFDD